ncbi:cell wall-binding repeat-containing protein [Agromyces sp. SYSU K20354]|uniref:cell wall-binding repeat-containing protein n=1 Tax=Agromyces cavernae TaxID=2898659 RepID=UPI001E57E7DC|nr:cell wall-binding repeat-containing protein [Agromyces cavernae]MCD2444054.1 cell wall-binding repeat-containing protein [Agromyces cavernae]
MKKFAIGLVSALLLAAAVVSPAHAAGGDAFDDAAAYSEHLEGQAARAGEAVPGDPEAVADAEARSAIDEAMGAASASSTFQAAAASGFTAGNLIADANFYRANAMSESQIQAFLVKMGAGCTDVKCLPNLKMPTQNINWSYGTCDPYVGAASESAARIIFKVQQVCSLSARVILVTLQKEQSLLTNKAPSTGTLAKAMGFGCPDTAACDPEYASFFKQVAFAARQLTWYNNPAGSFTTLKIGQPNAIAYHPNSACKTSNVTIANAATAALYYYTPLQPNAAAITNLYGTGDACSSYGNRNFWRMYSDWFGDPRAGAALTSTRLQGTDRYATAAAISLAGYQEPGVPVVYVASGTQFADALAAAPAAAHLGGPMLLTAKWSVPEATLAELNRLAPQRIVVVGGTGAIGASTASTLAKIAPVRRIGGADRYETSRNIAADAFRGASVARAYVATGRDFPDGLSAGAAAGALDVPVVLVDGKAARVDGPTTTVLRTLGVGEVRIAGGTGVVSSGLQSSLGSAGFTVRRYAGIDRYSTSVAINSVFRTTANAYVATGTAFPDALTGAAAAGASGDPLFLSQSACVPQPTRVAVFAKGTTHLTLLGGSGALSSRVATLQSC